MTVAVQTKTKVKRRAVLAAALALIGCAGAEGAYAQPGPVDLSVVDRETGQEIPVWSHRGRQYIAGRPGARYSLRVTNHTGRRVLVVLSVDGVNILTGETAGYDQRGYVFSPYETYDVNGWRKSDSEIAAFNFAALSQSYAARTGRPGDVGVIGMAVFNERVPPPPPYYPEAEASRAPYDSRRASPSLDVPMQQPSPAPAAPALREAAPPPAGEAGARSSAGALAYRRQDDRLGTGHGAREWSVVTTVNFERASRSPQFTRQIEYDTYAHLVARGVIPTSRPYPQPRPRPFPGSGGYVPDP